MSSAIVDRDTTVIGAGSSHGDRSNSTDHFPELHPAPKLKANVKGDLHSSGKNEPTADFLSLDEIEERPFFIRIGQDGVIGALQKLDKQLVNVRIFLCSPTRY